MELLMVDLRSSGLKLVKNLPLPHENLVRTWDFEFWVVKNTLLFENLVRSWDFEFWVVKNTPCWKWKFGQDLELWDLGCQEYPPQNENLVRTLDFEF